MASYNPPLNGWNMGEFNPYYFEWSDSSLTLSQADARYLRQAGGHIVGSLLIDGTIDAGLYKLNGSSLDVSLISGITPGIASASKALIFDSNKSITGIHSLTCDFTVVSGGGTNVLTFATAGYGYIGTSNANDFGIIINNSIVSKWNSTGLKVNSSASAAYALDVNGDVSYTGSLRSGSTILMDNTGLLSKAAQTNITSLGSLTGLNLNGSLSSTSNLIDCSSSLRITNGATPTNGSGGGFRYSGINSTFYISAHNHFLSTHNRIDIQDHLIYVSGGSDTVPDGVAFNTTTVQAKWQFHEQSSTANRLRISYSDSIASDQYVDSSGNHVFTNNISCASIGLASGTLSSNSSFRVMGSQGFVSGESLEIAYSTSNHQGNILVIDRATGIQKKLTLGGACTINAQDATIPFGFSYGGNPSTNAAFFDIFQRNSTDNRIRIGYDQTHYAELYTDSAGVLTETNPFKILANTNSTFPMIIVNQNATGHAATLYVNNISTQAELGIRHSTDNNIWYHYYNGRFMTRIATNGNMSIGPNAVTPYAAVSATIGSGQFSLYYDNNNVVGFSINNTHDVAALKIDRPVEIYNFYTSNFASTTYWLQLNPSGFYNASSASVATSLYTQYSIIVNNTIYSSSDRRLKTNIHDLDVSIDDYMKYVNPVSYDRVDTKCSQIGVIAQDLAHIHPLLISLHKNDKMKKEQEDDPDDGYQLLANYDRIPMVNTSIIKKLIQKNRDLESDIKLIKRKLNI